MTSTDPVARVMAAFNAHDATAFAAAFAPDALMIEYPDTVIAKGRDAIAGFFAGLFIAFPASRVELRTRIDLGNRQVTHEHFNRGDGSPEYDAALVYTLAGEHIARLDFIREARIG